MAEPSVQGRFIWEGLMTEDPAGATAFYSKVVGWRTEPWAADPTYTIFAAKSGPVAGMSRLTDALREQGVQGHWLGVLGAGPRGGLGGGGAEARGAGTHS